MGWHFLNVTFCGQVRIVKLGAVFLSLSFYFYIRLLQQANTWLICWCQKCESGLVGVAHFCAKPADFCYFLRDPLCDGGKTSLPLVVSYDLSSICPPELYFVMLWVCWLCLHHRDSCSPFHIENTGSVHRYAQLHNLACCCCYSCWTGC